MGRPHQQLPQRCAPEQHQSDTFLPCLTQTLTRSPNSNPNQVRQCNTFFPDDATHDALKKRMAAETTAFIKSLRNFLRGPEDGGRTTSSQP